MSEIFIKIFIHLPFSKNNCDFKQRALFDCFQKNWKRTYHKHTFQPISETVKVTKLTYDNIKYTSSVLKVLT